MNYIPKNKHNVYCNDELGFIHYSHFSLEMRDKYTGGTSNEALTKCEQSLKEVIKEAEKRLKIVQNARVKINQQKMF